MYYVYILHSLTTDKFYVGHTNDLHQRIIEHNTGLSKYTATGKPWKLVYTEQFSSRSMAMKREREIKKMKSRQYILRLIQRSSNQEERPDA